MIGLLLMMGLFAASLYYRKLLAAEVFMFAVGTGSVFMWFVNLGSLQSGGVIPGTAIPLADMSRDSAAFTVLSVFYFCLGAPLLVLEPKWNLSSGRKQSVRSDYVARQIIKRVDVLVTKIALVVPVLLIVDALFIDWGLVWFNREYTLVVSPDVMSVPQMFFVHQIVLYLGVLGAAIVPFCSSKGTRALIGMLVGYAFVFYLVGYSRGTTVIATFFIVGSIVNSLLNGKRPTAWIVGGWLLPLCLLQLSLVGRSGGIFGVESLAEVFARSDNAVTLPISACFTNLFQGAFVFDQAIKTSAQYDIAYVLKSLLPTMSLIDGWSTSQLNLQFRVNYYTPFSLPSELYFYPAGLFVIYPTVIGCALGALRRRVKVSLAINIICSIGMMFWLFESSQYYARITSYVINALILTLGILWVLQERRHSFVLPKRFGALNDPRHLISPNSNKKNLL